MSALRLEVFSDYLCPWCHLAAHRLKLVEPTCDGPAPITSVAWTRLLGFGGHCVNSLSRLSPRPRDHHGNGNQAAGYQPRLQH